MKFEHHKCPECGQVAEATLENLTGWALLVFDQDGVADWEGETKVDWNSQETDEDPMTGEITLRCPDGHVWQTDMVSAEFTTIPTAEPEATKEPASIVKPRALIVVRGGCAWVYADECVDWAIVDQDNEPQKIIDERFADLLGEAEYEEHDD